MVQKYFNLCKSMNDSSLRYNGNHFGTEMHNKNTTMTDIFVKNIVVFFIECGMHFNFLVMFSKVILAEKIN